MEGTRLTILLIVQMTLTIATFKFPGNLYKHGNYKGPGVSNPGGQTVSFWYPGSVTMADSLCAVCAAYNWVDCLMRFCYFGPDVSVAAYRYGSVASYYGQYRRDGLGTNLLRKNIGYYF